MLPFVLDLSMLFWNKDLYKEAGLDPEKAPATLAEYVANAKAIQALKKPGVYGTATGLQLRRLPGLHLVPHRSGPPASRS